MFTVILCLFCFVSSGIPVKAVSASMIRRELPIAITLHDAAAMLESCKLPLNSSQQKHFSPSCQVEVAVGDESIPYSREFFLTWDKIGKSDTATSLVHRNDLGLQALRIAMPAIVGSCY